MAKINLKLIADSQSHYAVRKNMENFLDITFRTKNYANLEFMIKESLFMTSEENYECHVKNAENKWLSALRIASMFEDGIDPSN